MEKNQKLKSSQFLKEGSELHKIVTYLIFVRKLVNDSQYSNGPKFLKLSRDYSILLLTYKIGPSFIMK